MKAATSNGATSTRATEQRAHPTKGTGKLKGKQRRGRAQNEATTTSGRTLKVACLNVQGLNEITKRQSIEWAYVKKKRTKPTRITFGQQRSYMFSDHVGHRVS